MAQDTDQELVKRVQKGDQAAFDMLFARYQVRILNLIGRYVRDADEVRDVAQEAFIKAYRAIPRFRGCRNSGDESFDPLDGTIPRRYEYRAAGCAATSCAIAQSLR